MNEATNKDNDEYMAAVIELRRGNRKNFLKFASFVVLVLAFASLVFQVSTSIAGFIK